MGLFPQISKGTERATQMLDLLGIDAQDAFGRDPIQYGRNLRHRALNCANCPGKDACDSVLEIAKPLETAPDFCPNKTILDKLPHR